MDQFTDVILLVLERIPFIFHKIQKLQYIYIYVYTYMCVYTAHKTIRSSLLLDSYRDSYNVIVSLSGNEKGI